ncbi:FAD-binding oxidoreductase [Amylibacter sp.]|nr:FAD-binding oxidoreductase [Amylibacter sp.]
MRVIVVGAGIWGLACAYACARRGDKVAVYDAGCVGNGASGGIVGALGPYVPDEWTHKKQYQFEALDTAAAFWETVDDLSGLTSGYGRIGRLQPLMTPKAVALAKARAISAQELWQGRFEWRVENRPDTMTERAAPLGVAHDTLSARINPAKATASLGVACQALGVTLFENHPVSSLTDNTISGHWGTASADAVIVATGVAGFDMIAPYTPLHPGSGVKGQAAILSADMTGHPQIYADGVYIIPHEQGAVAVGSTSEKTWANDGIDEQLDTVIAKARAICPVLEKAEVQQRWSGIRPKARRRDPMLGAVPNIKGVYSALGAFKIGFGLSHKIGETVASQIRGEPVDIPDCFTLDWHMAK